MQSVPMSVWEIISKHAGYPVRTCKAILQNNYRKFRGVEFLEADFPDFVRDLASMKEEHKDASSSESIEDSSPFESKV